MSWPKITRWLFGVGIALLITVAPAVYYRWEYARGKQLREMTPRLVYRCGQLTADGFADAVAKYHIRTIINLQDELPDPDVRNNFFTKQTIKESELCRQLGVRFVFLAPDLIPRRQVPRQRPKVIDQFLSVMDDPDVYPVLIHCRAGLHRTGVLAAVFRMEYEGWSREAAIKELKECGFGDYACTDANDYITQYILTYRPGIRNQQAKSDPKPLGANLESEEQSERGY